MRTPFSREVGDACYKAAVQLYRDAFLPLGIPVAQRLQFFQNGGDESWLSVKDGGWLLQTNSDIDGVDASDLASMAYARAGRTLTYWESCNPGTEKNHHHPVSWNYWRLLLEGIKNTSIIATYTSDLTQGLTNPEYADAFRFINRYAGRLADPGAWCAFRSAAGSKLPGDFEYLLSVIDTTGTRYDSQNGLHPLGPLDQRYGRYGLTLKPGQIVNLAIDPTLRAQLAALSTPGFACTANVTYLDEGHGTLTLNWTGGPNRIITKTDTGRWMTAPFAVVKPRPVVEGVPDVKVTAAGDLSQLHLIEVVPGLPADV